MMRAAYHAISVSHLHEITCALFDRFLNRFCPVEAWRRLAEVHACRRAGRSAAMIGDLFGALDDMAFGGIEFS